VLVALPRYYPFTRYSATLAHDGAKFLEIAGNRGEIVVSALVPTAWNPGKGSFRIFLTQPILTRPGTKRIVLAVPVNSLGETLNELDRPPAHIEHVYDY
jgi:hypothetical protein